MTKLDVAAMAADYAAGLSLRAVAAKHGTSDGNVKYILCARGYRLRTRGEAQTGKPGHGLKHGGTGTGAYTSWTAMHHRCESSSHPAFHNYGGRGIFVCERWASFESFLADMGPRPPGTELDRIDNNGNYEPGNCRWISRRENARNRRTSRHLCVLGRSRLLADWAAWSGVSPTAIRLRLANGWSPESAVMTPSRYSRAMRAGL